jgi:membrane peptidoglycan carboxypeptidase
VVTERASPGSNRGGGRARDHRRRLRAAALERSFRPPHRSAGGHVQTIIATGLVAAALLGSAIAGATSLAAVAAVKILSDGLPDPATLTQLSFAEPTVVYDRTGKVELGRFQQEQRRVVTFVEVPRLILDATTTAEDRTFWRNDGFDPAAILSAAADNASGAGPERGASTITQQLVRARLLPSDVVAPGADRYIRKAKELIQASRLTEAFPGETGKQEIITAYLNEIFYGHDAYGIAAAAQIYFGVSDLARLTPAQAALLAGLPKSPSTLDPYRYAEPDQDGRLVVPKTAPPVVRRDWILTNLAGSRWTSLTPAELSAALAEPVVLAGETPLRYNAPQFTWQVRRQLDAIVGDGPSVETGGYQVITTLDWADQQQAERWLAAGAIAPNLPAKASAKLLAQLKIPKSDRSWIAALRGKDLHNGALVAIDYRTGDVLAYAGSAGYYRDDLASRKFEPKYDAAGDGARQPGSAWKPILYATAFDTKKLTPGSLLLDIATQFGGRSGWAPHDADQLERGPVLVRKALQYSLNIPAIRVLQRVGNAAVADRAEAFGIRFTGGKTAFLQAGLAGALGTVEVRPLDLTSAYGAIANGGAHVPNRMILEVKDATGKVIYHAPDPQPAQVVSPQAAYLVTDILAGNTDPRQNPIWAAPLELRNGPGQRHRPAAVKTGTASDARDLATYGYLAAPADPAEPALAVGLWMGNSDHSMPRAKKPAISLTAAAPLWHAFVRDVTNKMPVAKFQKPKGIVTASIDGWSGGRPGPWTRARTSELFIAGTQPGGNRAVDPDGLLYTQSCGGWRVDPLAAELGPRSWDFDIANWLQRARRGPGVLGPLGSRTAYFWNQHSWGGPLLGSCQRPKPAGRHDKPGHGGGGHGGGGGGRGGGGGGPPAPTPPAPTSPP